MYVALRGARVNDKFQDSLYLFLELVRAGVMHGHLWSGRAFSGGPSFGTGKEIPASVSHTSMVPHPDCCAETTVRLLTVCWLQMTKNHACYL